MNKTITILFSILLFSSCYKKPKNNLDCDYYKKGIYFLKHSDEFEKNNNLYLERYGLNLNTTMDTPDWNEIHQFKVTFNSLKKLNLNAARKKLLHCIHEYLYLINNDKELKPYLYKIPFTYNDLSFGISFKEKNGKRIKGNYIVMCFTNEDMIYYAKTLEDGSIKFIHEETNEKALKIVQNQEANNE